MSVKVHSHTITERLHKLAPFGNTLRQTQVALKTIASEGIYINKHTFELSQDICFTVLL